MTSLTLTDPNILPETQIPTILGNSYKGYTALSIVLKKRNILITWRYYKDGAAWMGKMMRGTRNLGWIQAYDGYFTVTCYFTERMLDAVYALDITPSIKASVLESTARLKPMIILVENTTLSEDITKMIDLKIQTK